MGFSRNYLPGQYEETEEMPINHNYLQKQFADYEEIIKELRDVIKRGDFTLGRAVDRFEDEFSEITGTKYAIGVGSGTDALFLSLKALGIDKGDEVITTPYTFFATIGAIVTAGAKPVFVDILEDYNIDPDKINQAITKKTKVILPVHWSGKPCRMQEILEVANKNNLHVVEDACHAIKATLDNQPAGSFGVTGCFSLHPLKNLNVWGDGGVISTSSKDMWEKLTLMRNHGLINRDECSMFTYNSRLDTLQAVVARHLLDKLDFITESRIKNAMYFDEKLSNIEGITVPARNDNVKQVFHLYIIQCERRDELKKHLCENGVDAKVHYPIPMHLQPAAKDLGYKAGDFPRCEAIVNSVLSLPVHEFITKDQQDKTISLIRNFYQ